jgi:D-glycero-D-manno-heptose 1,7-bisphosphate phosphatase
MDRAAVDQRAAFIDRDGTLIEERGDLGDPADVFLIPGAVDAVRRLQEAGLRAVLVTNQSGIAKGLFSLEDYRAVHGRLERMLGEQGVHFDQVYFCPHHPDVTGACDCRKPGEGMYRRAERDLSVDLSRSFYVGDRWRDVAVTERVGGTGYIVRTGAAGQGAPPDVDHVQFVADLAEAVDRILASLRNENEG